MAKNLEQDSSLLRKNKDKNKNVLIVTISVSKDYLKAFGNVKNAKKNSQIILSI